jgi:UDP-N-acetylmuramyl tripeptide synthase
MKDPVLLSYTFEELIYEFHSVSEDVKAAKERVEQEDDKIEEAKEKANSDWIAQMEAEEAAKEATIATMDPLKDPANLKWMEEQLALDKEKFGEDFGSDVNLDFDSSGEINK